MSNKIMLGKGIHQSKSSKNIIITLNTDANIGQSVVDKDGEPIGKIFDIFGPVDLPFASIKLNEGIHLGKVSEKPFFLSKIISRKRKRRDKKHRRSR